MRRNTNYHLVPSEKSHTQCVAAMTMKKDDERMMMRRRMKNENKTMKKKTINQSKREMT